MSLLQGFCEHTAVTIAPPGRTRRSSAPDLQRDAIRRVAALLLLHLDGLAARSVGEIWTREAEFHEYVAGPEQLFEGCKVSLGSALSFLEAGVLNGERAERVRQLGRSASMLGMPLEVALRALRIDYLVVWSEMLMVARTTDARTLQSLLNASEPVWASIDRVIFEFTAGYRSRQDERSRSDAARREALVLHLLEGRQVDSAEVAEWLAISPTDRLVVVAAAVHDTTLRETIERVVRHASLHGNWARRGETTFGVVALRAEQPTRLRAALSRVDHLRAGLSDVHHLTSLPGAVRQAQLALLSIAPDSTGVVTMFDHPIGVLVAGQPDTAVEIVRSFLAGVLERPDRERELLLETLVAFDDANGSVADAAEYLFCHRNTVLNRLAKITRLTGAGFTAPGDLVRVALAAQVLRTGALGSLTSGSDDHA